MHRKEKITSRPPWDLTEAPRFLVCRRSIRLATGLFGGAVGIVFAVAWLAYFVAPGYTATALHAVMDFYQARADWAYRYLSGLTVVLLNNTTAALIASSLGVVGALLIARLHAHPQTSEEGSPVLAGVALGLVRGMVALTSLVVARIGQIRPLPARAAVSLAVLTPVLSLVCNGALLGLWLGSCLVDDQWQGILRGLQSIVPHAVFELPVICAAAAVGLHLALHLIDVAATQPQIMGQRAGQCLTSPMLRRTWGLLFLFVLIGAVIETRISWGIQERLYASVGEGF